MEKRFWCPYNYCLGGCDQPALFSGFKTMDEYHEHVEAMHFIDRTNAEAPMVRRVRVA